MNSRKFNYEPNIQYTFVQSSEETDKEAVPTLQLSREASSLCSSNDEFQSARLKSTGGSKKSETLPSSRETSQKTSPSYNLNLSQNTESVQDLNDIFRDRLNYLEQISESPLYVNNSKFPHPWKIVTKIQDNILREMVQQTKNDLNIFMKDENYVREFLLNELS